MPPMPARPDLPRSHRERFAGADVPHGARLRRPEVEAWLAKTRSADPRTRRLAVRALCPCHVQADEADVWGRIFEMVDDPDARTRAAVFHALTDGSPRRLESRVVEAIEGLRDDADAKLRRGVRKLLAQYRRTGRVNVN